MLRNSAKLLTCLFSIEADGVSVRIFSLRAADDWLAGAVGGGLDGARQVGRAELIPSPGSTCAWGRRQE